MQLAQNGPFRTRKPLMLSQCIPSSYKSEKKKKNNIKLIDDDELGSFNLESRSNISI